MTGPSYPQSGAGLYRSLGLALYLLLTGCQPAPDCPLVEMASEPANAGCLVIRDGRVLMTVERSGRVSLPGGTRETGESAQCTAFRETWEETGLTVAVGPLVQRFDNGFQLFRCDADAVDSAAALTPARPWETPAALWLARAQLDKFTWRFPEQQVMVRQWIAESGLTGQQ